MSNWFDWFEKKFTLREEDRKKLDFENDERLILENFTERKKNVQHVKCIRFEWEIVSWIRHRDKYVFPLLSSTNVFFFLVRLHFVSEPKKTHTQQTGDDGKYTKTHHVIGTGGFKKVYKGMNLLTGREVAWSTVNLATLSNYQSDALLREVKIQRKIKHK